MTVHQQQLGQWLQNGILAAKTGQIEQAQFQLLEVVQHDKTNEIAWYWLYKLFNRHDDKRICLENLITINPNNEWARQELTRYLAPSKTAVYSTENYLDLIETVSPLHLIISKLVAAFWAGISIIFLVGGIIALGEWLTVAIRSRLFPNYISTSQIFELLVALMFIIIALIGFSVAIGLFIRSKVAFYGSLLLALGLLFIGPAISLIASPTNYITLVCTGGISGMIILLTLTSQTGFNDTKQ